MTQIPTESLKAIAVERGVSDTEWEAVLLALDGQPTGAIAIQLGISAIAVRKRLSEVYRKFQIPGNAPGKFVQFKHQLLSLYQDSLQSSDPLPEEAAFFGRTEELTQLKKWILEERNRLVAIFGMPGIGKSALSTNLAKKIQNHFDCIIWSSLYNAPLLDEMLEDVLGKIAQNDSIILSQTSEKALLQLIDCLKRYRCLLILDDVEMILPSGSRIGRYRQGYEEYGVFLRQIAQEQHQSCLLLNSQEKLKDITILQNQFPLVNSLNLIGLDYPAGCELLASLGLTGEAFWKEFIKTCAGNPLALKIVSTNNIKEIFNNNVAEFMKFVSTTIAVRDASIYLDIIFNRLSDLEKEIMSILAQEGKPMDIESLIQKITIRAKNSETLESLASLKSRFLIETLSEENKKSSFFLQTLVRKYVLKNAELAKK